MPKTVSVDQLAKEITQAVREYTEGVSKAIEKEGNKVSSQMLKEVKVNAPKDTGEYSKGFKKTKRSEQGFKRWIIWNKTHPTLVHLLEFGHAKVNGGRVQGRPHLRPAYDKYAKEFIEKIKKIIRNGG